MPASRQRRARPSSPWAKGASKTSEISGIRRSTGAVQPGASASMTAPGCLAFKRANSGWASRASPIQFGATMRILRTGALVALGLLAFVDVAGAAVGAEHLARLDDVEEHARVHRPHGRVRSRAVQGEVGLGDLDEAGGLLGRRHQAFSLETFAVFLSLTGESQSLCLATRPATTSKNSF